MVCPVRQKGGWHRREVEEEVKGINGAQDCIRHARARVLTRFENTYWLHTPAK